MDIAEMVRLLYVGVMRIRLRGTPAGTAPRLMDWCRPHKHPYREILFVLAGESEFLLNNEILRLSPGDAVPIDAWAAHPFGYPEEDSGLTHLWIHLLQNRQLVVQICSVGMHGRYRFQYKFADLPGYLPRMLMSRWNALLLRENCAEEADFYLASPIDCALQEIAMRLLRRTRENRSGDFAAAIQIYIESLNGRGCSLQRLEDNFGYSGFYLAHRFKQETGLTIGDFIDRVRLNFTRGALERGMKQKEIAGELGFSSPSAFWKWYHQKNNASQS